MKSKKKNEMEKAQNTMGAAQELDMDDLEDVAGGRVGIIKYSYFGKDDKYGVFDDNGKLVRTFSTKSAADKFDKEMGHASGKK